MKLSLVCFCWFKWSVCDVLTLHYVFTCTFNSLKYIRLSLSLQRVGQQVGLSYRWYHARKVDASKWDFSGERFKVFWMFYSVLYHVSMKLLEITKCYSKKARCFQLHHSFSKIFIHIDITVHTPFLNWHLHLSVLHRFCTIGCMCQNKVNVAHWLNEQTSV